MSDETVLTDTPVRETKPASLAVQMLCKQFAERFIRERDALANVAFQSDQVDPEQWVFDTFTGVYTKVGAAAPQE